MSISISIPKKLYEEALKRSIDVEELVLSMLAERLQLDPQTVMGARVELAERFLEEAKIYVDKGDAVQASEKLYKTVEECIKVLAEFYNIPEYQEALKAGRWKTGLLDGAVVTLSNNLKEPTVVSAWDSAYYLHVQGFHENKLTVREVSERMEKAQWLLEYTKKVLKGS